MPHVPLYFPDIHSLQPQLDCGARDIKVLLDRCQLESLGFGDEVTAYLRDHNCSSITHREEGNWVSVVSPAQVNACGNILEVMAPWGTSWRWWGTSWRGRLAPLLPAARDT